MKKNLILSNRSLPMDYGVGELPARIHIVPRGELVNKEAGVTQVLDDKALNSILADLQNNKAKNGGLYFGEEHFIYNADRSSEAFAWGKEFGLDDKGIWATAYEPTDVGAPALKNKRFKWTSFAADPASSGAVENLGKGRVRILKIDTVGFTNFPNGKALLAPMSNKNNFDGSREPADSTANNQLKNKKMKTVCTLLGLSAEADETSVHAAVTKLLNRPDVTPEAYTVLKNSADRTKTLETENQALLGEQCEAILDGCGIKTDDKRRPHLVNSLKLLKNRDERMAHLADFGLKPGEATKPAPQARLLNRGAAASQRQSADESEADAPITPQAMDTEVRKIMNRDGIKFDAAFNTLRREQPKWFAAPATAQE
jgi:hypothetical protein